MRLKVMMVITWKFLNRAAAIVLIVLDAITGPLRPTFDLALLE
jgi:hypothetical protein